jgi:Protein of unknown function (DUF3489)
MSPHSIAKSQNPKNAAPKKGSAKSNPTSRRKVATAAANTKTPLKADEPKVERVTKQVRVLTLLSQPAGASIDDMMQATDWQQHSVRGFLAGTVRQRAIQADLMRWDNSRGHYVLTGTGRSRISARSRVPGAVVRFKSRNDRGDAAPHRKAD